MLGFLLKKANKKVICCGNSFKPLSNYYSKFNKVDFLIVEQSSFQLHDLKFYNPFISIILNLQENHQDSSYSLNSYFENKKKIYKYQNKDNYFIYDFNNTNLNNLETNANVIDLLTYPNLDNISKELQIYRMNLNYIYTIFLILKLDIKIIEKINEFKTLKFREEIKKINGITYINNSKATSVDATIFALSHIEKLNKVILIIGGKDKNSSLKRLNNFHVKYLISYGEINKRANVELNNVIPCDNLDNAFNIAKNINLKDKIILFSPSESSFDQYKNYIQRRKHFDKLVKKYGKN